MQFAIPKNLTHWRSDVGNFEYQLSMFSSYIDFKINGSYYSSSPDIFIYLYYNHFYVVCDYNLHGLESDVPYQNVRKYRKYYE